MNEKEFKEHYENMQRRVTADDDLKRRAAAFAQRAVAPESTDARAEGRPSPLLRGNAAGNRADAPASIARRWVLPAAACLAVAALVAGGAPAIVASMDQSGAPGITMSDAAASGFTVRAYASDGTSLFTMGNDGTVVFDRVEPLYGIGDDYATEGYFTGCLFRVEGAGIARVQMNVETGKLYRYTIESFRQGDEPDKMKELIGTKPLNRGLGTYYGSYDDVNMLPFRADTDVKNNADALVQVGLSKLYGATVDVSAADDPGIATGETSFGLWTNEGDPNALAAEHEPYAAVIDQFENKKLTVTVTFEDGHTSTQFIELHAADFLRDEGDPYDPNDASLVPEIIDPATLSEDQYAVHSLYGTVVEASKEAFPLPLDGANEAKDTVLPAATLDARPSTYRASTEVDGQRVDVTFGADSLLGPGETTDVICRSDTGIEVPLTFGYPAVTRGSTPPNGKAFAEFEDVVNGWFGDTEYVNVCSHQVFGYGFNDDGSLTSDEHCYLMAEFSMTNNTDQTAQFWPRTLGEFAFVDDAEGHLSIISGSYALDYEIAGDAQPAGDRNFEYVLEPGQTAQVTLLRVVPNHLADHESLLFLPGGGAGLPDAAFAVGDQV